MNGRSQKKIKQLYNREVRGSFNIWRQTVNDKPKWLPIFAWAWILKVVFKADAADLLNKVKNK